MPTAEAPKGGSTKTKREACWTCGKPESGTKQCAECKVPKYCSNKCAEVAWPAHKTLCGKRAVDNKLELSHMICMRLGAAVALISAECGNHPEFPKAGGARLMVMTSMALDGYFMGNPKLLIDLEEHLRKFQMTPEMIPDEVRRTMAAAAHVAAPAAGAGAAAGAGTNADADAAPAASASATRK